jgi:hypothetical protein
VILDTTKEEMTQGRGFRDPVCRFENAAPTRATPQTKFPTKTVKLASGSRLWIPPMRAEKCRWSQNSCAYDVVFTSVFVLWCGNRQYWTENMKGMGNTVADLLLHGFSCYEKGEALLEDARDNARHLIARSTNSLPFGHNTSIEIVSIHFLSTNKVITERYYICHCPNHGVTMSITVMIILLSFPEECTNMHQ